VRVLRLIQVIVSISMLLVMGLYPMTPAYSDGECDLQQIHRQVAGSNYPFDDPCDEYTANRVCWYFEYPDCPGCEVSICAIGYGTWDSYTCECDTPGSGGNLDVGHSDLCVEKVVTGTLMSAAICERPEPCVNCEVDDDFEDKLQDKVDELNGLHFPGAPDEIEMHIWNFYCNEGPPVTCTH
jgi:hypothetical protein